jgi:hypothetical protein
LLWNGLSTDTRRAYISAHRSFEYWCKLNGVQEAYPAQELHLGEWLAARTTSGVLGKAVKANTLDSYLSAIRSVHVDRCLPVDVFQSPWLRRIIDGRRRMEPPDERKQATVISPQVLAQITTTPAAATSIGDLTFDTAAKVAFAGMLRLGEFTINTTVNKQTFQYTKLTRSDITFPADRTHAILRLKRSKTDTKHEGVDIVLPATGTATCPYAALRELFDHDPKHLTSPLFQMNNGEPITRDWMIKLLHQRLQSTGTSSKGYSGHSFRRGGAQAAADNGLLVEDIKAIGRWSSDAAHRYFQRSITHKLSLARRFLLRDSSLVLQTPDSWAQFSLHGGHT